jgi:hypothetical protein
VEVVVLSIADANKQSQNVDDGCNEELSVSTMASLLPQEDISRLKRTLDGRVFSEVLCLVTAEETLGLDLGGSATGKFLVEADNSLHAKSIGSTANRL